MQRIFYDNFKTLTYAKKWCVKKSNSYGVYLQGENESDCAHFIAHCLAAGGIIIKNSGSIAASCLHGLAGRNVDIVAYLKQLAANNKCDNVKNSLINAIISDTVFLKIEHPRYAFTVYEVWSP